MGTSTFFYKYRPVRVGFLVEDGNVDDIVMATGINTLLWGGIYNPIITVSGDTDLATQLLKLFLPDVLFAIRGNQTIDKFLSRYPSLRDPSFSDEIFYDDWRTKKKLIKYL